MPEATKTVEKKEEETAVIPPEVDYQAILAEKDAELAKVRAERENYRKGLLKAKGKLPDDSPDNEDVEDADARTRRIVEETLLTTKEAQLQAEKDEALKAVLKRNKELEVALKSRGQITVVSGMGSNEDKPEVKTDSYFSTEQIQALKSKGWDDKKIEEAKKNMLKGTQMPR